MNEYKFVMVYVFNYLDFSKHCKEKILEICAVQTETTDKQIIVICVYRSPSGDFNHFFKTARYDPSVSEQATLEILICGDINVDYLLSCNHKQKLSLSAYNMMHTVGFPTRFQNGRSSATENTFVDKSRMQSYVIFPLSNALSDDEAQCIVLNKFFLETNVKDGKYKKKCKVR